MNKEQIQDAMRLLLAVGGPVSALLLKYTGMSQDDWNMWVAALLVVVPPTVAWVWGYFKNTNEAKVAAVAELTAEEQKAALNKVSAARKVQIAEATPGVATVVVRDTANGKLAALAADEAHPNIVTESQNEADAKKGIKAP